MHRLGAQELCDRYDVEGKGYVTRAEAFDAVRAIDPMYSEADGSSYFDGDESVDSDYDYEESAFADPDSPFPAAAAHKAYEAVSAQLFER